MWFEQSKFKKKEEKKKILSQLSYVYPYYYNSRRSKSTLVHKTFATTKSSLSLNLGSEKKL